MMPFETSAPTTTVRLAVTVTLNAQHEEILDMVCWSPALRSATDVLCSEVKSNLESLRYVVSAAVEPLGDPS